MVINVCLSHAVLKERYLKNAKSNYHVGNLVWQCNKAKNNWLLYWRNPTETLDIFIFGPPIALNIESVIINFFNDSLSHVFQHIFSLITWSANAPGKSWRKLVKYISLLGVVSDQNQFNQANCGVISCKQQAKIHQEYWALFNKFSHYLLAI